MSLAKIVKKTFGRKTKKQIVQGDFIPRDEIVGNVVLHQNFASKHSGKERPVLVWMPSVYKVNKRKRFPVLYMHDGQNIMDPRTAYIGVDWRVDEWAEKLIAENKTEPFIVVGIYNTPDRLEEYSDSPKGTAYRRFIIEELKPFIDSKYRTLPDRENTAIMGSSMGGLCSLLTIWKEHEIFSKAACLSSSFYYGNDNIFNVIKNTDHPLPLKVYIDSGEDGKQDAQKMFRLLSERGNIIGDDFDYFYDIGAQHTESAWAARLERPLRFLFPPKRK